MKKFLIALLMVMMMASPAMAGWYVKGNLGADILTDYDDDVVGGAAIGYDWNKFRIELEDSYMPIDGLEDKNCVMVNGILPYKFTPKFGVYGLVGLGIDTAHRNSDTVYQAGAGLEYDWTEKISTDVGYRYRVIDDMDDTEANLIQVGIKYHF